MARFCPSRGFILDLGGWEFAVPFYFVQDCSYRITVEQLQFLIDRRFSVREITN